MAQVPFRMVCFSGQVKQITGNRKSRDPFVKYNMDTHVQTGSFEIKAAAVDALYLKDKM